MVPDPGKPRHCPGSIVLIASYDEISIDGYNSRRQSGLTETDMEAVSFFS